MGRIPLHPLLRVPLHLLLLAAAGSIAPASAQVAVLDRGEFEVGLNGRETGTETFSIRRLGTGDEIRIIADGRIRGMSPEGASAMDILMEVAGSAWTPFAYQNKIGGAETQQIGLELRGTRYESRVTSGLGERVREYRALPGMAIIERGVAHHFHFLAPHLEAEPATLPIIVPRDGLQLDAAVAAAGAQDVRIGDEMVSTRRYRVSAGSLLWEVWYDDEERVMRVTESSTGYSAVRKTLPGS